MLLSDRQSKELSRFISRELKKVNNSKSELGRKIGVEDDTIRRWLNGVTSLGQPRLEKLSEYRANYGYTPPDAKEWLEAFNNLKVVAPDTAEGVNPESQDFFSLNERLNEINTLAAQLQQAVSELRQQLTIQGGDMHQVGVLVRAMVTSYNVSYKYFANLADIPEPDLRLAMHTHPTDEQLAAIARGLNGLSNSASTNVERLRSLLQEQPIKCEGDHCCRDLN